MSRPLLTALLVSVLVHTVIVLVLFNIRFRENPVLVLHPELSRALEMSVLKPALQTSVDQSAPPETIVESEPDIPVSPTLQVSESETQSSDPYTIPEQVTQPIDSIYHVTHDTLFMIDTVYLAKGDYIPVRDSLFIAKQQSPFYKKDRLDLPPDQFNLPRMLFQGAKKVSELVGGTLEPKLDFIPTQAELEALELIWKHHRITGQNIYAQMDTSIKMSKQDMDRILSALVDRGILKRKIVSPEYKVMLFVAEVEVSSKNLRNRVYEYEPLLPRDDMKRFLNALYYQLKTGQDAEFVKDSKILYNTEHVKKLLDRLFMDRKDDE